MEILRIAALALCAVILIILVKNYKPEFGIFVAIGCGVLILYFMADSLKYAFSYLSDFYNRLDYGKSYFPIIIKVLAVAYITEFTAQLCRDAGESSIASKVELAGKVIIFAVTLPLIGQFAQMVLELL